MKTRTALLLAATAVGGLVLPTNAVRADDERPKDEFTQLAVRELTFEETNGFAKGKYIDWSAGRTQVLVRLFPDARTGANLDVAVAEWSLEAYATPCGEERGALLDDRPFFNDPKYGPRINEAADRNFATEIRSVIVVHDGSTPAGDGGAGHTHAIGDPGRHEVACVDL